MSNQEIGEAVPIRTLSQMARNLCALCGKDAEPDGTICPGCREKRTKESNIVIKKETFKSFAAWTIGTVAIAGAGYLGVQIAGNEGLALVICIMTWTRMSSGEWPGKK